MRLFEGGAYSSNYCNWQLKSLLHLGQIVITFRTKCYYNLGLYYIQGRLLHLGSFITFRPSTPGVNFVFITRSSFESLIQLISYSSFKNFQNFQKTSSFVKKDSVFLFRPVNFLGGRHNRFTIAATFGATASTCMELFFSGKSGIFIEGGPPWVKGKYGTSLPDP